MDFITLIVLYFFGYLENVDPTKPVESFSPKETSHAEDERITIFGEKKHEKSEIVKRRPRAILAATPMLEEIPEEKSHGSGSDTSSVRASEESKKGKKNKKQVIVFHLKQFDIRFMAGVLMNFVKTRRYLCQGSPFS